MGLLDNLLDDETLVRRPETPAAAVVTQQCELIRAYPGLLATLVVPDRQLTEVAKHVPHGASVPVSVITSAGAGGLLALARHDPAGIDVASVEPTLRDLDDLAGSAVRVVAAAAELASDITVFIELPYAPGWESAVEVIEAAGRYAKIAASRTEPRQLVEQLSILIEADLPFKITSSNCDWLALVMAVEALIGGASPGDAAKLLELDHQDQIETEGRWDQITQSRVRRRLRRVGTDQVPAVISGLTAYGLTTYE